MAGNPYDDLTWLENKDNVINFITQSRTNYILDLPTGLYRLDAGRRMRTLRSILEIDQIQKLVDAGELSVLNDD